MTAHIQEDFAPNADDLEVERVDYYHKQKTWTLLMEIEKF